MSSDVWTIRQILGWSVPYLKKAGSDSARLDCELLLAKCLSCQRLDLYLDHDKPLQAAERSCYREMLKRRAAGEPIAYILGVRDFFSYQFQVTPDVLIPRPETEHVVECALEIVRSRLNRTSPRILDVGTGSGCIAIALKKTLPEASVTAWDVSESALAVARRNAEYLDAHVEWQLRDALAELSWTSDESGRFDVISTNPPYIGEHEIDELPKSVIGYEPELALIAPQEGLAFYRLLAELASQRLTPSGYLVAELGASQGAAVQSLFQTHGWFDIQVHQDLAGLDRVVVARRPESY
jgi:release factor glutamine methyltransferase